MPCQQWVPHTTSSITGPTLPHQQLAPHATTADAGPHMPRKQWLPPVSQRMWAPQCHVISGSHLSVNGCGPYSATSSVMGPSCGPPPATSAIVGPTCHVNSGSLVPHQQMWAPYCHIINFGQILKKKNC